MTSALIGQRISILEKKVTKYQQKKIVVEIEDR